MTEGFNGNLVENREGGVDRVSVLHGRLTKWPLNSDLVYLL